MTPRERRCPVCDKPLTGRRIYCNPYCYRSRNCRLTPYQANLKAILARKRRDRRRLRDRLRHCEQAIESLRLSLKGVPR